MYMKKRFIYITIFIFIAGLFFYISRGPNISNLLKKNILPELEAATGKKFIAQHAYVNLYPFFVELKGVKAFDDNGTRIITADRVKGYLGIMAFFRKELLITRLVIKAPDYSTDRDQLAVLIPNIKKYLSAGRKHALKTVIKSIEINQGLLSFSDKDYRLSLKGLNADITLSGAPRLSIVSEDVLFSKKGQRDLNLALHTVFSLKGNGIEVESLKLDSDGSVITTHGQAAVSGRKGDFKTEMNIVIDAIKKMFGLKKNGDGKVSVSGEIKWGTEIKGPDSIFIDLRLNGRMFLETLMELLGVKEHLYGRMTVNGQLKGYLNKLEATGSAMLENGGLFGVDLDKLKCNVSYKDRIMHFSGGNAVLYGGQALAEAHITLPSVNEYDFNVKVRDIKSNAIFRLIGWDPHVADGRVSGFIASKGKSFEPVGRFHYKSRNPGSNVLERIREAKGEFSMKGKLLHISNAGIATETTNMAVNGYIDMDGGSLDFSGKGSTSEIRDVSAPYLTALSGPADFNVKVFGTTADPSVRLGFESRGSNLSADRLGFKDVFSNRTYLFPSISVEILYNKNLLSVNKFLAANGNGTINAYGKIHFNKANAFFDFRDPNYDMGISLKNIDIGSSTVLLINAPRLSGKFNADLKLQGAYKDIISSGSFKADNISLADKFIIDSISGRLAYSGDEVLLDGLAITKGRSVVRARASLNSKKDFFLNAESNNISIEEIINEETRRLSFSKFMRSFYLANIKITGSGNLDNPKMEISGNVNRGHFKSDTGVFKARLRGRDLVLNASMLNEKLDIKAKAELSDPFPWTFKANLQPARYDFLISSFLNDAPDDLILNLSGEISAYGNKDSIRGVAGLKSAHLFIYGNAFANEEEIRLRINNKELFIDKFSMKSETSEFNISGNVSTGKSYSLLLEGSSSLAPLRAFSRNIDVLKGKSSFVFLVSGDWNNPKINGGMDVSNGTLGFKNIPYRLSSVSAYIYADEDKIVIDNAIGKIAGGDIKANGTAYLQRFKMNKFYLESLIKGITVSLSKDFWVNLDGNLFCQGTPDIQSIMGDVNIKKARFTERIEWKSWLIKARSREVPKVDATKLQNVNLNINVQGNDLKIDNNIARAYVSMDLLLRGTIGRPVILGKAETKEGFVFFRNNEFKIIKTRFDFSNPDRIQPYFDIVSETSVSNYKVKLNLDGSLEQFNMTLSSNPPLDESDIFSLLTVGYIGKNMKGIESGIGAAEATSFLTGKLQDVMEERLRTITGIDRVQIDPYVSRTTGTVTPRVTVAKKLMGDKLYVTYSTAIGTVEEQVLKLEYHVSENTSLLGVRDERGGMGGDVTFRFGFR